MTSYFVGDKPGVLTFNLYAEEQEDQWAQPGTTAEATVEGITVASTTFSSVLIKVTTTGVWETEGLHAVTVKVTAADATTQTLSLESVVVEATGPWMTMGQARLRWAGAANLGDVTLYEVLSVAKEAVLEFAPVLAEGAPVPARYVRAQQMQARNMLNASRVNASGDVGDGDFVVTPRPLDWHVRALLRPQRGRPLVG